MKLGHSSLFGTLTTYLLLGGLALATSGCQKDEAPPPLPTPKPAPTPTVAQLVPEDEEEEEEVEEPKAATKRTGSKAAAGPLTACCQALRQNAANAPPETKGHMLTAAAACEAANAQGNAGFLGGLNALLKGANMPPACQ